MERRHRILFGVLLALMLVAALALQFGHLPTMVPDTRHNVPVTKFTLKNGLQVVIMPNTRIPAVAHILFVRSGGADDPEGKSGIAHYLEHLMFTGTPRFPEGAYERAVVREGGKQNAYTSRDFTAYYTLIAKDKLPMIMDMESDRLQHLTLEPARVARELKVITEERKMRVENDAAALFSEQLGAVTFLSHPYRQPLIGWPADMAGLTAQDARDYFDHHYIPSNMLLLIAGDVDVNDVKREVEHYYGGLTSAPAPVRSWPKEPAHRLAITASMTDEKAHEKRLLRQYVAPSVADGDTTETMPLSVLAQYLGSSQTGLLYRRLVLEQKIATGVSVDYDELSIGPALLRIVATPAAGVELPQLKEALDAVLEEARTTPPAAEDLVRAKTGLKASVIFAQDGLLPLAQLIGHMYMSGKDEQYFYDWPQAVEAVTAEQVLAVARTILAPEQRITGYLLPREAADAH